MKKFICLATIYTALITLLTPSAVKSQTVLIQGFPSSGYSSTTIYIPSTQTTTTTTIDSINSNTYPNRNPTITSTTTTYPEGSYPTSHRHQQRQSNYPRPAQVNCTTSIIGSPIPSPVALNQAGQLCR
jgi:hypothetical protein